MPPDSVYVCEGLFSRITNNNNDIYYYQSNNESPALEYGVNHNTIPPNFQVLVYPSDFNENAASLLLDRVQSIEINLYFSYL